MQNCPQFYQSKDGSSVICLLRGNNRIPGFQKLDTTMQEGAGEKHMPVVRCQDQVVTVSVGSIHHPMTEEHGISWICVQTDCGQKFAVLEPKNEPTARFALLPDEHLQGVYAYCNQHGLWYTKATQTEV